MIPGIIYLPKFITQAEEQQLLSLAESYPGRDGRKLTTPSRMVRFGRFKHTEGMQNDPNGKLHGYTAGRRSYGKMNDGVDVAVTEVPQILSDLGGRLIEAGVERQVPGLYVLNKYSTGYKIGRHIDHEDNGPVISVVGLKSAATMVLSNRDKSIKHEINFEPRALLALTGPARWDFFHEIYPVKSERWSLVFRNVPSP